MKKQHLFTFLFAIVALFTFNACTSDTDFEELTIEEAQSNDGSDTDGTSGPGTGGNPPPAVGH